MGSRGPAPKRAAARIRRNKDTPQPNTVATSGSVKPPPASGTWHPQARRWYRSLGKSGQSRYFEPSDWEFARLQAELLSLELRRFRPRATMISIIFAAMRGLGVTEGDRRRMSIEIERRADDVPEDDDKVAVMDRYRRSLG